MNFVGYEYQKPKQVEDSSFGEGEVVGESDEGDDDSDEGSGSD